jgi:hypothetical protein
LKGINPDELFIILSYGEYMVRLADIDRVLCVDTEYVSNVGRIPAKVKSMVGKDLVLSDGRAVIAAQARTKLED